VPKDWQQFAFVIDKIDLPIDIFADFDEDH
jgi:hypothetical protein